MTVRLASILLALLFAAAPAPAQEFIGPPAPEALANAPAQVAPAPPAPPAPSNPAGDDPALLPNPVTLLDSAARAAPGLDGNLSGAINIMLLLTVLTLAPAVMVMCTSFIRFIIVFGLLRQALGAQNIPPAQVITALALFMTLLVMSPTIDRINREAVQPYRDGEITSQIEVWERARQPVRDFMFAQIEAAGNWSSLYMVMNYRGIDTSEPERLTRADADMLSLIPAYMLKVAFLMGFRVYLPFLIIDMVIASLLISMSMMMLPPVLISLPFKLLLFVLVDGWQLVVGSLLQSVARPDTIAAAATAAGG
jgi:flagellar biosynthetic protein FliP